MDLVFATSNEEKRKEIGLSCKIPIIAGADLPEIDSEDPLLIAMHKAKDAWVHYGRPGVIVEDTVLIIDGVTYPDIKFKFSEFRKNLDAYLGKQVVFMVTLAFVYKDGIYGVQERLIGEIVRPQESGYAFDPYIFVDSPTHKGPVSLACLAKAGLKHKVSPRNRAINRLFKLPGMSKEKQSHFLLLPLGELEDWAGGYQEG